MLKVQWEHNKFNNLVQNQTVKKFLKSYSNVLSYLNKQTTRLVQSTVIKYMSESNLLKVFHRKVTQVKVKKH